MATLEETRTAMAGMRAERDAARTGARALDAQARQLRAEIARVARGGPRQDDEIDRLQRELDGIQRERASQRARAAELDAGLLGRTAGLAQASIDELFGQLDDHLPVVLLPVRLETKFALEAGRDGVALRVRIFPDDIHVSTHDPALSPAELDAGAAYWSERSRALGLAPEERRTAEVGAWSLVAERFGGPRARYVTRATEPVGWPAPGAVPRADILMRDTLNGTPPRAKLLPDFFVVTALDASGNTLAREAGRAIPDGLQLGPDPEAPEAAFRHDAQGKLVADDRLAWLTSYSRAVDAGMAVTLQLPSRMSVARVVAIGVRFSLSPADAAAALEGLFSDHRFTDGIDVLAQGSPTNNTDGAESAFTTDLAADEALVEQEVNGRVAVEVLDHADKTDGQRLAEALGIGFDAVKDWPNAVATDVAQGLAMNRALWPATLDTYLEEMIAGRLPQATKSEIERFFLTYVTGRNLLPSVRVGSQPYGVLATSDLRHWQEPARDGPVGVPTVLDGLRYFRAQFEKLEPGIAQMGRGTEPLKTTMRVIGQQASSVAFASRKAVTDEIAWKTLMFTGTVPLILANWFSRLEQKRDANFAALGIDRTSLPLAALVYFDEPDPFTGPVVDQDPEVPLSETQRLSKFDGNLNYIDWLLSASAEDLRDEVFKDKDGARIAAPKALLYRLLHHAWTMNLSRASKAILARLRPAAVVLESLSPSITNVGPAKVLPDEHAYAIDSAAIGLTQNAGLLGDFVLGAARSGASIVLNTAPEALPLQSQRDAIVRLASLTTAQLERLLAEHLDLVSYRLDAWQTGLVAQRLDGMRRQKGRAGGLHLASYGYVEDLEPRDPPALVAPQSLPEELRGDDPVREQVGDGGFVHAPSLAQGVTAAVLRNAYLTHTEPALRDAMSVNLTSRRVRTAMEYIEGMRAGQELAALLGYQIERGLHERYPGVELDQYIYALRARFPLVSRRLTPVPDGTPAEQIEARNVIDGYDLIEYVRTKPGGYPYDIAGLPAAGSTEAKAIVAEIALLEDALDAVSDLLTAESVHQAVQSNIDRARGALASVTDGEIPPVPDVVQTPRSGRAFTQRVALHLPSVGAGWPGGPSPRSRANPRLNAWLCAQLPDPATIGVEIRPSAGPAQTLTLAQTTLDAIDCVLMSGDRLGDGSSELERYLADRWRELNPTPDATVTVYAAPAAPPDGPTDFIRLDAAAGTAATTLAQLLPHLRALRRLVGTARGLDAQDYRLPSEKAPTPDNPKGYALDGPGDLVDLPGLVGAATAALDAARAALVTQLDGVKAAYEATLADANAFSPATWTPVLPAIRAQMRTIARFGVPEAWPRSTTDIDARAALAIYEQGRAVAAAVAKRVDLANAALAPLPAEPPLTDPVAEARRKAGRLDRRLANLQDAARQALGAIFAVQPAFVFDAAARAEIEARIATPVETDALRVESWLQGLARVRTRLADLSLVCTAAQWLVNAEPKLLPVQLPLRAGDPWIGAQWPANKTPAAGDIMSVMTVDVPGVLGGNQEGLLLDDWTETVPTTEETTGLVFNFDRPNAAAPQALLIAVPPSADGRWQWTELLGTVTDTFDRARLRAIEPDDLQASPLFELLPATLAPFTQLRALASLLVSRDYVVRSTE
jgi:hypothetical protein